MTQRVIKYRAWDTSKNRMYYHFDFPDQYLMMLDCTIFDLKGADELGLGLGSAVHDRFMLMQFTGLLDKHGKEIYEGDIRKEMFDGMFNGDPQREHYFVMVYIQEWTMFAWLSINSGEYHEYLKDGAEALDTEMYWTYPAGQDEPSKVELVGNIYTTPELVDPKMIER